MVKNLGRERAALIGQVWKHIIEVELKAALADYDSKKSDLDKAIKGIQESINTATSDRRKKEAELRELRRAQRASSQPSMQSTPF